MSILITGGSGFIGSNLDGDIRLSSTDCDLRDYHETIECFKKYSPTIILHCAAKHGNFMSMHKNPVEMFTDNMLININVFKASKELKVKKMINFTSVTAFPDNLNAPYTESDLHLGEPHLYTYGYAYAKRMVEILNRTYRDQYNLDYVCVLLSNIYGPNNDFNLKTATVISKLIKMCYIAKRDNTDFIIGGDGSPIRDFLFVDDVRLLTNLIIDKFDDLEYIDGSGSIIFSNGISSTIKEVVECIVEIFQFKGNIIWDKNKVTGQSIKISNNSKLLSLYPNFKFTKLRDGIEKTITWFLGSLDK